MDCISCLALFFLLASNLIQSISSTNGPWNNPSNAQYHIQTDEGPERYFRYQTLSGQYRKEKRLEDGTVVGTYAWIDENGYLRQRDYIADKAGYRILRSKHVYVGRDTNVGDAIKAAKKVPSNVKTSLSRRPGQVPYTGTVSVTPKPFYTVPVYTPSVEVSPNSIPFSTPTPLISLPSSTILPPGDVGLKFTSTPSSLYVPSSTPKPASVYLSSTPTSYIPPTSTYLPSENAFSTPSSLYLPSSTPTPASIYLPSSTPTPYPTLGTYLPFYSTAKPSVTVYLPPATSPKSPSIYLPSSHSTSGQSYLPPFYSTPKPPTYVYLPSATPQTPSSTYLASSTPSDLYQPSSTPSYAISQTYVPQPSLKLPQILNTNSLDYSGSRQYEHYSDEDDFVNPYIHQNGPTYPIDKNGQSFKPQYNNLGDGYNPQYPYYDGISVTNDGFRYYIPRAYHEEQNMGQDTKSGSFGYIDPFGIRRVIYYNAGPGGFKHRKNNRYVGFNATPYDPRPY